jgi:hypothetical protein
MRTAPKALITIIAIIAGLGLVRLLAKDRFVAWCALLVFAATVVDGLWEKQTAIGLRQFTVEIPRTSSPVAYWVVIAFYSALSAGIAFSLFFPSAKEALQFILE